MSGLRKSVLTALYVVIGVLILVIGASLWLYPTWLVEPVFFILLPVQALIIVIPLSAALLALIWYINELSQGRPKTPPSVPLVVAPLPPIVPAPTMAYALSHGHRLTDQSSLSPTLPSPLADFTGRKSEIETLTRALTGGASLAISGISGMGGIGKTALALYIADKLKSSYPDAQVIIDLKGTSKPPMTVSQAMQDIVHKFEPQADLSKASNAEIAEAYSTVLSQRSALIILDNAADAWQVNPLMPPPNCGVLVTSRNYFVLPGLTPLRLEVMSNNDAQDLLLKISPRIDRHAGEIAKLCGYLPLALRIVASTLAEHKDISPSNLAKSLEDRRKRIAKLKSESTPNLDVEAAFELSYDRLTDEAKRRWRALAVFPGSFWWSAAAEVWELKEEEACKQLSDLVRANLIEYSEESDRHSLHDLLASFADVRLSTDERWQAQFRHAQHYLRVASAAHALYLKGGENVMAGLRHFDAEWQNIRAGQAWASSNAAANDVAAKLCYEYPNASVYCLFLRLHSRLWIDWLDSAVAAARKLGNKQAEGTNLGNLGLAYFQLGDSRKAIKHFDQTLAIAREIGDRRNEGAWLGDLGSAYANLGDAPKAIEHFKQALAISRELGDQLGESQDLGNLGNAYLILSDAHKAIEYYKQALAIDHEFGNRLGEETQLGNLGLANADLGDVRKAIEYYEQALAIAREIGDRRGEGTHLVNLGNAYAELGDARKAIEYYEQALAIDCEIGDRHGEGQDLGNLGSAYADIGNELKAIEYYEQALAIAREVGDRRGEGNRLSNLGKTYLSLGNARRAIEHYEQALAVFRAIDDQVNVAKTDRLIEQVKGKV